VTAQGWLKIGLNDIKIENLIKERSIFFFGKLYYTNLNRKKTDE